MKTCNEEAIKAMANVLAGMVDEDHASYYSDAMYVLNAIREGRVPGVIISESEAPEYDIR